MSDIKPVYDGAGSLCCMCFNDPTYWGELIKIIKEANKEGQG